MPPTGGQFELDLQLSSQGKFGIDPNGLFKICGNCCPSTCCPCWIGSTGAAGGCCYSSGDRVRLTIPRPGRPTSTAGSLPCGGEPYSTACAPPPPIYGSVCCAETSIASAPDFWREYEWAETNCFVEVFASNEGTIPDPNPGPGPGPGPGPLGEENEEGEGEEGGGGGAVYFCHRVLVFTAVEDSPSLQEAMAQGLDPQCFFPMEWHYICSGCQLPPSNQCVLPEDHRPTSELPCRYLQPDNTYLYLAARPALGWRFICEPDAPCPFCIGACAHGPVTCTNTLRRVHSIQDFGCGPVCVHDGCIGPCIIEMPIFIGCVNTITYDLSKCDGGDICCYPKMMRGLSCEGDWECVTLPKQTSTLRRVDQKSCVWDDDPVYRCRSRTPSDSNEPVEVNECPPNPNP